MHNELAERFAHIDPSLLDEAVQEVFAEKAAQVNRDGIYEQVAVLVDERGYDWTERLLEELNEDLDDEDGKE